MSVRLTREDLARFAPRPVQAGARQDNWDGYIAAMTSQEGYALFKEFGIDTRNELCAFLANAAEETGDWGAFTCLWENLYFPTVHNIRNTWPGRASHYSDAWIQANLVGQPQHLGDWAYGGRMGNGVGNGDGYKYRGFGILQTTGKTDHLRYYNGDYSYLSSLRAALMEWRDKGCDRHIAQGDFRTACILINGGTNGLSERQRYYALAQRVWKDEPDWTPDAPVVAVAEDPDPSLVLGPAMPEALTASDLADSSRKVSLLQKFRNWMTGLGVTGTGLSLASLGQPDSPAGQAFKLFKENAWLLTPILCIGGAVVASAVITWIVEDARQGRYIPSGG